MWKQACVQLDLGEMLATLHTALLPYLLLDGLLNKESPHAVTPGLVFLPEGGPCGMVYEHTQLWLVSALIRYATSVNSRIEKKRHLAYN